MTGKTQESKQRWENEGGALGPEPKQTTPKGLEIPLPKRSEVMDFLHKVTMPKKKKR